jgi:hypothetical protein
MLKMRLILTIFTIIILFAVSSVFAEGVNAQVFKFQLANPSETITKDKNFQVKIMINTAGKATNNGDALINFDPAKVSINSATTGNFFTYFSDAGLLGGTTNKYLVSSWEGVGYEKTASTDTLFATLNLTAKACGSTSLSFDCTAGSEADSNINQASDSKDIIQCPLQSLNITVSCGTTTPTVTLTPGPTSSPSATPKVTAAPTSTPSATPTKKPTTTPLPTNTVKPTVTVLPRAGAAEITFLGLGIGLLLTVVGVLFIL